MSDGQGMEPLNDATGQPNAAHAEAVTVSDRLNAELGVRFLLLFIVLMI